MLIVLLLALLLAWFRRCIVLTFVSVLSGVDVVSLLLDCALCVVCGYFVLGGWWGFLIVVVVCDLVLVQCLCCWLAFNTDVYLSLL